MYNAGDLYTWFLIQHTFEALLGIHIQLIDGD